MFYFLFTVRLQRKGNLCGRRECEKQKTTTKKRLSALVGEHLGYLYTQTQLMFVSAADQWQEERNIPAPKHAACACSAAYHESCHWFRDHNNSQASHSVMEISHLIENLSLWFLPRHLLYTIWTLWCPLNIADGFGAYLQEGFHSSLLKERTVNHP